MYVSNYGEYRSENKIMPPAAILFNSLIHNFYTYNGYFLINSNSIMSQTDKSQGGREKSGTPKVFSQQDIAELSKNLTGNLYLTESKDYNEKKEGWALTVQHEPAIIIEVKNTDDVITAINFAGKHQLFIAVQSTGHGASHPCIDHMLIKTTEMNGFSINIASQTIRTEAGATWENILKESQRWGLVPLTGFVGNVGVTGYTIGGGFGWLVRKYGIAADQLLSLEMVTLKGEILTVTADEHPDLFWGVCGGGNFGIITALTMKLFPIKDMLASQFYYLPSKAEEVMEMYRNATQQFPEEMTSTLTMMHLPPVSPLPEALKELPYVVSVKAVYLGDKNTGERLLAQFKDLDPVYEKQEMMSYQEASQISHDPKSPGKAYGHVEIVNELSEGLTGILSKLIAGNDTVKPVIEIRHIGGAMAKVPAGKNAFGHRDTKYMLHIEIPLIGEATIDSSADYLHSLHEGVKPFVTGGTFLNFIGNVDISDEAVKAAFEEEDYARLRELKRQYDPGNVLRFNFNIPPAAKHS